MGPESDRNNVPDSLSISSSSVKVCKEFNWDVDGRDMERARCEATVGKGMDRRPCTFRVALYNTWRCMMTRRTRKERRASGQAIMIM